jgi:hypothetical protein
LPFIDSLLLLSSQFPQNNVNLSSKQKNYIFFPASLLGKRWAKKRSPGMAQEESQ